MATGVPMTKSPKSGWRQLHEYIVAAGRSRTSNVRCGTDIPICRDYALRSRSGGAHKQENSDGIERRRRSGDKETGSPDDAR
jgi:hypothetical protein